MGCSTYISMTMMKECLLRSKLGVLVSNEDMKHGQDLT